MIKNISVAGLHLEQYPDFTDAFIDYAETVAGRPLNQDELDWLNTSDMFYDFLVTEYLPGIGEE